MSAASTRQPSPAGLVRASNPGDLAASARTLGITAPVPTGPSSPGKLEPSARPAGATAPALVRPSSPRVAFGWLAQAPWLTADRATSYSRLLAAATLVFGAAALGRILLPALSDPHWRPLASDFAPFWSGARLALQGHPQAAYDLAAIHAMENTGAQSADLFYYLYPPVWMMLCLPLGALPYAVALLAFQSAGFGAWAACLRRLMPQGWPVLPLLAFPAAILNLVIGQNGLYSATCFAAATLLLDERPALAGACLGFFACKPQLAVAIPIAFLAARRWPALAACAATACTLVLLSWVTLGTQAWQGFSHATPFIRSVLTDPGIWPKLVSLYSGLHLLGVGTRPALAVQAAAACASLACVAWVARHRPGAGAELATIVAATMLCTPYLMDYDLVCLSVPMAWIAVSAAAHGWRPWEKTVLAACVLLPLTARASNLLAGLSVAPPILAALLAITVARARTHASAQTP